jgi:putative Mg2+ transporter-C (MgtC) family protein
MAFLHSFAVGDFLDSLVSLFAAFVLGGLIGAERRTGSAAAGCGPMSLSRSARQPS